MILQVASFSYPNNIGHPSKSVYTDVYRWYTYVHMPVSITFIFLKYVATLLK